MKRVVIAVIVIMIAAAAAVRVQQLMATDLSAIAAEKGYTEQFYESTSYAEVKKISYDSIGTKIYGLLAIPKGASAGNRRPAFVLLPANSITKEAEQKWAGNLLNRLGFVTLSIDERGQGETQATVRSLQDDLQAYVNGIIPVQQLMVDDALNAFRLLRSRPEVDASRIYMLGESMGGRFAVIAAATEPEIAGLVLISTAGYNFTPSGDPQIDGFLGSIDPDQHIAEVSPREIIMIHSEIDPTIPMENAEQTFSRAREPKAFYNLSAYFHGYLIEGTGIEAILEEELKDW